MIGCMIVWGRKCLLRHQHVLLKDHTRQCLISVFVLRGEQPSQCVFWVCTLCLSAHIECWNLCWLDWVDDVCRVRGDLPATSFVIPAFEWWNFVFLCCLSALSCFGICSVRMVNEYVLLRVCFSVMLSKWWIVPLLADRVSHLEMFFSWKATKFFIISVPCDTCMNEWHESADHRRQLVGKLWCCATIFLTMVCFRFRNPNSKSRLKASTCQKSWSCLTT